jgi:hypothetical protein
MNEQLRELAKQAEIEIKSRRPYEDDFLGGYLESDQDFILNNYDAVLEILSGNGLEKFARLIIEECCNLLDKEGNEWLEFAKNPPQSQEDTVSSALFAAARLKEDAVVTLKEHFGIDQ